MSERGLGGVVSDAGQTVVAGRYRLLAVVASGGMGRVWRARDELLDREVAVKEIVAPAGMPTLSRREMHLRTVREARTAARLGHPGVVRIFDVLQTTNRSWIVMEYVRSRSLHQVVAEDGPLSHAQAARVGLAVLAALRAAHAAGVLHLDVKPHNVLITAEGRVVLTDFGLATFHTVPHVGDATMPAEPLLASPRFVAPERLRDGAGDARTDLWALGATLYAAVEGRPPFDRPSVAESLTAVLAEQPDPPRIPGPLHPVIAGLLRTDPARRTDAADAQSMLQALARRAVGVVAVPAPRRPTDDGVRFRPATATVTTAAPPNGGTPAPQIIHEPPVPTQKRPVVRTRIALVAAAVLTAVAASMMAFSTGGGAEPAPRQPSTTTTTATTAASAPILCPASSSLPVTPASTAAPYPLPGGWLWHVDPDGFALPVPQGWTRTAAAGVVSFCDPVGVRSFTVQPGPPPTGDPLQHWQAAEKQELAAGTLGDYQRISMGVLLVSGGGADWEYTWQPVSGPRLHTHRLLIAADSTRSYLMAWTTRDQDWNLNLSNQRTVLNGVRDLSTSPSAWAVPPPKK